jgi:hypothetical protein
MFNRTSSMSMLVAVALATGTLVACSESHDGCPAFPYCDGGPPEPDAGTDAGSDAYVEPDAGEPDATPPCVPVDETCNGADDDCDGALDETPAEAECAAPNAAAACAEGSCVIAECDAGFADCDADASNGCETDTETDASACGACGFVCGDGIECHDGVCDDQRVVQVSVGDLHACALRRSGEALCWGANVEGQLGTGDRVERLTATPVVGGYRFREISLGARYSCGLLLLDGRVACWGDNTRGQLGDGTTVDHSDPRPVLGLVGIRSLSATSGVNPHVLAVDAMGVVWGWGYNVFGELGEATRGSSAVPTPVLVGVSDATSVAVSWGSSCVLLDSGAVHCLGLNVMAPPELSEPRWTMVTVNGRQSCAIDDVGDLFCWEPAGGILQRVDLGSRVVQAVTGSSATCAVVETGALLCWGSAMDPADPPPSLVAGLDAVVSTSMLYELQCALDVRGRIWCWNGPRVGDGTALVRSTPVGVIGIYP